VPATEPPDGASGPASTQSVLTPVPPAHAYAPALSLAEGELATGRVATAAGNDGKARVCCRRAVGIFIQTITPNLPASYGSHAMANLRGIEADASLPDEIRSAAARLLGGARSIAANEPHSTDPLADAVRIINYFVAIAA
jgi:hypothetical protein